MKDPIDRSAVLDAIRRCSVKEVTPAYLLIDKAEAMTELMMLPAAEPKISRIEQELHGKTPEEQYEFLYWLLLKFGLAYTDSRLAVIEWLRGEKEDEWLNQQGYRMIICKQHVAIYRSVQNEIFIYHIADTRTDYTKLFRR